MGNEIGLCSTSKGWVTDSLRGENEKKGSKEKKSAGVELVVLFKWGMTSHCRATGKIYHHEHVESERVKGGNLNGSSRVTTENRQDWKFFCQGLQTLGETRGGIEEIDSDGGGERIHVSLQKVSSSGQSLL